MRTCTARCYQPIARVSALLRDLLEWRKAQRVRIAVVVHLHIYSITHLKTYRESRLEQTRAPGATTAPPGSAAASAVVAEGPVRTPPPSNPELEPLERELCEVLNKGTGDAFTTFLYGLVLMDRLVVLSPKSFSLGYATATHPPPCPLQRAA